MYVLRVFPRHNNINIMWNIICESPNMCTEFHTRHRYEGCMLFLTSHSWVIFFIQSWVCVWHVIYYFIISRLFLSIFLCYKYYLSIFNSLSFHEWEISLSGLGTYNEICTQCTVVKQVPMLKSLKTYFMPQTQSIHHKKSPQSNRSGKIHTSMTLKVTWSKVVWWLFCKSHQNPY